MTNQCELWEAMQRRSETAFELLNEACRLLKTTCERCIAAYDRMLAQEASSAEGNEA